MKSKLYYKSINVGKYRFKTIKIGILKIEICMFKRKFMFKFNIDNWSE